MYRPAWSNSVPCHIPPQLPEVICSFTDNSENEYVRISHSCDIWGSFNDVGEVSSLLRIQVFWNIRLSPLETSRRLPQPRHSLTPQKNYMFFFMKVLMSNAMYFYTQHTVGHLVTSFGSIKPSATPWRWRRTQSLKRRRTFTSWGGCLRENISLISVAAKASRLIYNKSLWIFSKSLYLISYP
jgi:hypothetical protein